MTPSPFANSIRPLQARTMEVRPGDSAYDPRTQGIMGSLMSQFNNRITRDVPQANVYKNMVGSLSQDTPDPMPMNLTQGTESFYAVNRPQQPRPAQLQPANPFEGNEQYQALMEYQKSISPQQEQLDRLNELRTAFEGTGGYKDYRIQQMEQQMQRMQQPRMGMGLGGMRPTGMGMFGGFPQPQRNPYQQMPTPRGGYNQYNRVPMQQPNFMQQPNPNNYGGYGQQPYQQPYQQQQYGMMGGYQQNPYQQMRPQPQQFGGYGMGQSMGGYGGYGGMQNSYAPQQYGQQSMGQPQQFGRMY